MIFYIIVAFLLMVSAVFLGDALRRLKNSFREDEKLVVHQKTMCLHITALFIHTFFLIGTQIFIVCAVLNPSKQNYNIALLSAVILWTS